TTLATGGTGGTATLWDIREPRRPVQIAVLRGQTGVILSVAFSPNGEMVATGNDDGTAWLWDITRPGRPVRTAKVPSQTGMVYGAAAFNSDGRLFVTVDTRTAVIWDVTDARHPRRTATLGHTSYVSGIQGWGQSRVIVPLSWSDRTGWTF